MPIIDTYDVVAKGVGRRDYSGMVEYSTTPVIRSYQNPYHVAAFLLIPVNYTTGTAIFTLGSPTVTGVGTVWTAAMAGRRINNGTESRPEWFLIDAVVSPTEITLDENYWLRGVGTTGVPIGYTIGGALEEITIPEDITVVLYDFIGTRPNNKLMRMLVESRKRGQSGSAATRTQLVDKTDYQTVEAHIPKGWGFAQDIGNIWITLFNYDIVPEGGGEVYVNGLSASTEAFYLGEQAEVA